MAFPKNPLRTNNQEGTLAVVNATSPTNNIAVTGRSLTGAQSIDVSIIDGSGNQITSFGGGTQYTAGTSTPATPTGTMPVFDNGGTISGISLVAGLPVNIVAGGGSGGGPADVASNVAANESDAARQKVTSVLRLYDTGQTAGSQLVTAKGDQTNGLWVNVKTQAALPGGTNVIGHVISDSGSVTNATLSAETTKVIGTVRTADGAGNLLTSNSTTTTSKFGLDSNILSILGTAPTTAGKLDVKGADGDVFVRQATAGNLNATIVGTKTNNNATPGTNNIGALVGIANAAAPTYSEGDQVLLSTDLSGNVRVTGSLSVGGTTDNSAYTAGTSTGTPSMGFYHSVIDTVTDGRAATVAITSKRAMMVNLNNSSGTEIGTSSTPLEVTVAHTGANSTAIKVDGTGGSFPVSGTVSATQGTSPWVDNLTQINSHAVLETIHGTNTAGNGGLSVGIMAEFDDVSPTSITENQFGNVRMSANRNLYGTIRDAAGNERGVNVTGANELLVNVNNSPAVTISSGSVSVSGTVTANQGTAAASSSRWPVFLTDGTNAQTFNSTTTTSKFGADVNILSILGTAPSAAGKLDVKGADGDVFVRQTSAANLLATVNVRDGSGTALTSTGSALDVNLKTSSITLSENIAQINAHTVIEAGSNGTLAVGGNQATNNNISTNTNPILIAGSDYGGTPKIQSWKVDSSGNGYILSGSATGSAVPANAHFVGAKGATSLLQPLFTVNGAARTAASGDNLLASSAYMYNGTNFDIAFNANTAAGTTGTGVVASSALLFDGTNYQKQTTNSITTTSKFGADVNILSILGTAPTTAGFLDIQGNLSTNNAIPNAKNIGVLSAIANNLNPSYTEGNQVLLSTDLKGNLRVAIPGTSQMDVTTVGGSSVVTTQPGVQAVSIAGALGNVVDTNGDKLRVDARGTQDAMEDTVPSQSFFNGAVTNSLLNVKVGRTNLYYLNIVNTNSTSAYIQVFDNSNQAGISLGTSSPTEVWFVPALGCFEEAFHVPLSYTNGIQIAATTTATGSSAPSTGLIVNLRTSA